MNQDQIAAVLARLLGVHEALAAWNLATPATNGIEEALKARLSAKEDRIQEQYDELTALLLQLVGKDISAQADELDTLSARINATAADIAAVEAVIALAAQVAAAIAALA